MRLTEILTENQENISRLLDILDTKDLPECVKEDIARVATDMLKLNTKIQHSILKEKGILHE